MDGSTSSRRRFSSVTGRRKDASDNNGLADSLRQLSISRQSTLPTERTVKRMRLSKALTVPENITVYEVCRRMATRKVDAVLLTDSNALLCGIFTDKDVATRVIACELKIDETPVSQVMSRNPVFVLSDTLAVEALQKMIQGKFRHLPVVENGVVIAMLDIEKCLYDAITRMERAAEKGKAIAAAVEGVEKQWGASASGTNSLIESIRDRMFKPSLSTIIPDNPESRVAMLAPSDSVLTATKKMLEFHLNSIVVAIDDKPRGILTSRDILMRVVIQNHPPESTSIEKVMTQDPECATLETSILDALHTMHDGKFLHLPIVNRDGNFVSVIDVIHITQAAVATVGNIGVGNEAASSTMMQKFWDSSLHLANVDDDCDTHSDSSVKLSEGTELGRYTAFQPSFMPNTFRFKLEDRKGRKHRFICDARNLADVMAAILQRVGDDIDRNNLPQILYEDEDKDKVILESDEDLIAAVDHAKVAGWKGLKLHLDYSGSSGRRKHVDNSSYGSTILEFAQKDAWASAYSTVAAGAALFAGIGVLTFLKRTGA